MQNKSTKLKTENVTNVRVLFEISFLACCITNAPTSYIIATVLSNAQCIQVKRRAKYTFSTPTTAVAVQ